MCACVCAWLWCVCMRACTCVCVNLCSCACVSHLPSRQVFHLEISRKISSTVSHRPQTSLPGPVLSCTWNASFHICPVGRWDRVIGRLSKWVNDTRGLYYLVNPNFVRLSALMVTVLAFEAPQKLVIFNYCLPCFFMTKFVREWVSEWMSEWVNEWVSYWISEWVTE